ncbi:MAG TPA: hypothetical protein VHR38_14765 [Solirubrobacterales bacterium]|nr:hypothetical protein [Solirubrobacterales bacterium]
MKSFVFVVCGSALATSTLLIGAPAASAASTRAEYIAQVDPICQANLVPVRSSGARFQSSRKKMNRLAIAGNGKAWLRQSKRTASALDRFAGAEQTMIEQIALVSPPPADSTAVGTWVNGVTQADAFRRAEAAALRQLKIAKANRLADQVAKAQAPAYAAIADFGFQVCWQKV